MSDDRTVYAEIDCGSATLTVYEKYVEIERKSASAFFSLVTRFGKKEIPIEDITGIEVDQRKIRLDQRGFERDASGQDLNTIVPRLRDDVDEVAELIRSKIRERQEALSEDTSTTNGGKTALETLRQRFAEGEITEDEFRRRRDVLIQNE